MSPEESKELAGLLASRFIERRDVKAIQSPNGAYYLHRVGPQKEYNDRPTVPFDFASLVAHVEGRETFGHYLVSHEGTCRMFCFDIDFTKESVYYPDGPDNPSTTINPREVWSGPTTRTKLDLALQIKSLAQGLAKRTAKLVDPADSKVMVAYSGNKGMHVICTMPPGTPADDARATAVYVLETFAAFVPTKGKNFFRHDGGYHSLEIEVFPKQDEVNSDGYGNLVRLPLGINRKSGKPGFFLRVDDPLDKFQVDDPFLVLKEGSFRE